MQYIDNRLKANIVKLEDANNNYESENVEGALEEIDSKIKTVEANAYDDTQIKQEINNIKTEIGTEELTTTNKTIKGAVNEIDSKIEDIEREKADKSMVGSPLIANLKSDMSDTTKVYVYVGNEEGLITGNWYAHNGTEWISGGVYNSQGIGNFEIDNIKVKNIDVNKINFDKYSHINSENYSIRKVIGINWETIVPIFGTSADIATVTIDLTGFEFDDLYFKPTNISGQNVIYYTEGLNGKNLTYNNIIAGKDKNFVYDEVSGYCKVDVNSIKATYSTIVIAMNKAECEVYSTAKNIIGSQHIKDKSIYPRHIADKEMLRDTICMSSNNYFDVNLCEKKYSGGYDVGTGLPIWTVNNTTADKYRTITLPIGENGHIIIKKPNYYDNVVVQCYYLKQDGTLANNFTTRGINKAENTYPYNVNPYTEVNSDYIKVYCADAKTHNAVKLTITYHYANEILEDLVYINYKNAFIPEWLDVKGIVSNIQNSSDIEIN